MSVGRKKLSVCQNNIAAFSCCWNISSFKQQGPPVFSSLSCKSQFHSIPDLFPQKLGFLSRALLYSCFSYPYSSQVLPALEYCSCFWGCALITSLYLLNMVKSKTICPTFQTSPCLCNLVLLALDFVTFHLLYMHFHGHSSQEVRIIECIYSYIHSSCLGENGSRVPMCTCDNVCARGNSVLFGSVHASEMEKFSCLTHAAVYRALVLAWHFLVML